MKKIFLAMAVFVGSSLFATAQVLTIDSSGNVVTPTGSVSSIGFNASGAGAGRLSLTTGADQQPLLQTFELLAPLGMPVGYGYQEIAPLVPASGFWRSDGSAAAVTAGVNGSHQITYNVTVGGSYSEVPACWIVVNPGASPAFCTVNLSGGSSGSIPLGASSGLMITQSPPYALPITIYIANTSQMSFVELMGDATTTGSNQVTVAKINGTSIPTVGATDQVIVSTAAHVAAWKPLTSTGANQFLTYSSGAFGVGSYTCAQVTNCTPNTTTVNGHALSSNVTVTAGDVGLSNVTNNAQTQSAIVPNTAPSAGQMLLGNTGGTAYAPATMSQDCTVTSSGVITCLKTNGTAFGTGATATIANYALLASPMFTGTPNAPMATPATTNTGQIATTSFVQSAIESGGANVANCHFSTYPTAANGGATLSGTANRTTLWGIYNPFPCMSFGVIYGVGTVDNSAHTYDLGLICGNNTPGCTAGNIVVHTGSKPGTTFAPGPTGPASLAWAASAVIPAGTLYIALTSSCTTACATIDSANNNAISFLSNTAEPVTAGGTLNNGITIPSDSATNGGSTPALVIY